MIPLTLITGFLGSGKTTFLQNVAASGSARRIGFVVNEFASIDIDGSRLNLPEDKLVAISGGSIFCKCKVSNFIGTLEKLAAITPAFEGIIVEASGIADPKVIGKMLNETGLTKQFYLARVISLADPGTFYKLLVTLPNIRSQIESASLVLVNKTDLYSDELIEKTKDAIIEINPAVEIVETINAKADDIDIFATCECDNESGNYASCSDPNYFKKYFELYSAVDWEALKTAIDDIEDVYRVKGFLPTSDGVFDVDYAAGVWEKRPATSDKKGGLVVIANSQSSDKIKNVLETLFE